VADVATAWNSNKVVLAVLVREILSTQLVQSSLLFSPALVKRGVLSVRRFQASKKLLSLRIS
jgi:hypothetical protein